jgi:hypothetical protein
MVIGAVTGIIGGKKKKKAAKKQKRIAEQQQALAVEANKETEIQTGLAKEQFELGRAALGQQRQLDRIESVRSARIRRANLISSAVGSGIQSNSAAVTGAVGALTSSFQNTLGVANIFNRLQDKDADIQSKALDSQGRVAKLQGESALLGGESQIVQAKLDKSMAGLNSIGKIGGLAEKAITAGVTGGAGGIGGSGMFGSVFGAGKTTSALDSIFGNK